MRYYCTSLEILNYSMTLLRVDYTTLPRYRLIKISIRRKRYNKKYKEIIFDTKCGLSV